MMNLLFSPSGRINSAEFMKAAYILIAIAAILALLPLISTSLSFLGILGLVMIWCWVVLWVKRYHDGGKSGWMCLIPIVIWIVLSWILSAVVLPMFAGDAVKAAQEAANAAAASGDIGAVFKAAMGSTKATALPSAILGAVASFAVAFLFNNMIKGDPGENQFGPAS